MYVILFIFIWKISVHYGFISVHYGFVFQL